MSKRGKADGLEKTNVVVISRHNAHMFQDLAIVWFANTASLILKNKPLETLTNEDLEDIHKILIEGKYLENLKKKLRERELGKDKDVCKWSPIPLHLKEKREIFNLCYALEHLKLASQGKVERIPLPPSLSLEFAEFVRTYMPTRKALKRETIEVESDVLALALIGATETYAYKVRRGEGGEAKYEYGYVFIDVYNPLAVNVQRLTEMSRRASQRVAEGGGSMLVTLVGVASAIALVAGKALYEPQAFAIYNCLRLERGERKTLFKGFDVVDLTGLARTIAKLRLAQPVYRLVDSYPSENDIKRRKEARAVRSFIESLARAVYLYHTLNLVDELYSVSRMLDPKSALYEDASKYLGAEMWNKIVKELLEAFSRI